MDGLDGLAAGTAIICGVFLCIISFSQGSNFVYIISYALIAGSAGFFIFNFPRAKLFMGDVGSTTLGFIFASLAVIGASSDQGHLSLFIVPLLLLSFIYDASFTFIRRLLKGENVFQAHKTHLYQLLNQLGFSHVKVSCLYFIFAIFHGFGAFWILSIKIQ